MMMIKIKVARVLGGLAWTSTSVFAIAPISDVCNPVLRYLWHGNFVMATYLHDILKLPHPIEVYLGGQP